MEELFVIPEGELIHPDDLSIDKAKELASIMRANSFPYISFLEARRKENSTEIIVFETEVELGQRLVHDIRQIERIAVEFYPEDNRFPEVLVLRTDFPAVPHLNLREYDIPRSLCLYELDFKEHKLRWTPIAFIERIREWLAQTAHGILHAIDQPLEPFFISGTHIILPIDLLGNIKEFQPLLLEIHPRDAELRFLECRPLSEQSNLIPFIGYMFMGDPQEHGIIHKQPSTLQDLHTILSTANIDLVGNLRDSLKEWLKNKPNPQNYDAKLLLIVVLPKTRKAGTSVEMTDIWAFICLNTILQIGDALGSWEIINNVPGILIGNTIPNGETVKVAVTKPIFSFSKDLASSLSGINNKDIGIVLIGTGALGSQVLLNMARMGYGSWTLVDNDFLLPHNLARHGLHSIYVGVNKAVALQQYVSTLLNDGQSIQAFNKDIIISSEEDALKQRLDQADIILDISTSIAVARHLALDVSSNSRRLSMFMNPVGYDVVVLAEDTLRNTTLDYVEMLYYLVIIHYPEKYNHHLRGTEKIRYSNSCRDVSNTIPQDLVALQSAICSRALQQIPTEDEGSIQIWRTNPSDFSVQYSRYTLESMIKYRVNEWTICTDRRFINRIYELREGKLPKETGGVLIGSFDMQRKIVYVMDTISSPPDSREWPTLYIRGFQGLQKRLDEIRELTSGGLEYVGEWHSHPAGYGCLPSLEDRRAFSWLETHMSPEGKPALMMIAGDRREFAWYLGKIV
ncbi:ThiF family adenylyltransferase [Brevibacillus sp. NPDC058079]|uniref:ThiF family adenylyltransferase n=1 Tax=Brevibacillus sp. NPDC058079 TaxID=3346330 RepID=UPI0036E8BC98